MSDRWSDLDALLDRLYDSDPEARDAMIQEVEVNDSDLAREARRLLAALAAITDALQAGSMSIDDNGRSSLQLERVLVWPTSCATSTGISRKKQASTAPAPRLVLG